MPFQPSAALREAVENGNVAWLGGWKYIDGTGSCEGWTAMTSSEVRWYLSLSSY